MSRKLDALVAERVMGWYIVEADKGQEFIALDADARPPNYVKGTVMYRAFSSDIAAAMEAVYYLLEYAHNFELEWLGAREGWQCYITEPRKARRPEVAICIAALRAVGVSEEEIQEALS